jgi:glutamine cyclotransferase
MSAAIQKFPLTRFLLAVLAALTLVAATAGAARAEITDTSECYESVLSQHFSSFGDYNWYAPVPGQDEAGFNGEGWTLSNGAQVVSTTDARGRSIQTLELPTGARAVSPTICVTRDFPTGRMMVRSLTGDQDLFFYVSYAGTKTWTAPKSTDKFRGRGNGWELSDPINLQPSSILGWQLVKFTLVAGGKNDRSQVYDFWVDPFARH